MNVTSSWFADVTVALQVSVSDSSQKSPPRGTAPGSSWKYGNVALADSEVPLAIPSKRTTKPSTTNGVAAPDASPDDEM